MTIRGLVRNGVIVPVDPQAFPEGAEVEIKIVVPASPIKSLRQGGIWHGKVQISDDFDELPDDLAEAFGIRTP